ncbi:efflux RND transporter periplasmic adaptor subunit [Polynucleobacter sp. AP-Nickl1-40-C4]|jgi:HlyD family secretion protein|uniref:efflux RND transporter periplasmic adaptor subunit n=1 Tax=Polynucleobacter sp. AP-Nickl1-40-C4 TaxID=3108275 RepID=UPI002B2351A9|nr:efflux RND transporter periplasmic adaptor subunit [Polynucleobacter sp. AP-Nickl1-40-C4]MEA9568844.1 efflux RND transporter periplasmic adaptor subunit [Polynucleobacter sp. AP-Nickl1-40-C4]
MKNKLLIGFAIFGVILAIGTAYVLGLKQNPLPPAFNPASNPYSSGIYAEGIIESLQSSGSNINIYPEVAGTVNHIPVKEGQDVAAGDVLLSIDDSVQRAATQQAKAQIQVAQASLKTAQDTYAKQKAAADIDPRAVSKDTLDSAKDNVGLAMANVELARRQYDSAASLLAKFQIKALSDGKVISINTAVGSYASTQGVYDTYTQQSQPIMVIGAMGNALAVRCYVDEVLLQRLPSLGDIDAYMFIRGSDIKIPLKIVRLQPNVTPKIELSNQRTERVDVRVLPVIFSFSTPANVTLYPGQLVDVYIGKVSVK